MSDQVMESELLVELSTEDQQLLSGGQRVYLPIRLYGNAWSDFGQIPVRGIVYRSSFGGGPFGGGGFGGGGFGGGGFGGGGPSGGGFGS